MNLQGMTQLEVEELFSQKAMQEQFKVELEDFMKENMKKEYYQALHKALDNGKDKVHTFQVMLELIAKIGSPKLGTWNKDVRIVEINHLVSIIAGLKSMTTRFDNQYRYLYACNIVEELDTILFDVQQKKTNLEGDWITETYAEIGFVVGEGAILLEGLNRFKFPLIEKPLDWSPDTRGGYHSPEHQYKITYNKGASKQPEQVCSVLNILQGNKYVLRDIDLNDEYEYIYANMMKGAISEQQKRDVPKNATVSMLTCFETYSAMQGQEFYFTWGFDCRGRGYSKGYDINLQAGSYKKGMLKPVILTKDKRVALEQELKQLETTQKEK